VFIIILVDDEVFYCC